MKPDIRPAAPFLLQQPDARQASDRDGKRAVILLTDGKDNKSVKDVDEVIRLAREAEIPLHFLGPAWRIISGGPSCGGWPRKRAALTIKPAAKKPSREIFEQLSILLHDEGVDETSLKHLADSTGGKYFPAADISQLKFIYQGLAEELQTTYRITFPSLRQEDDGTSRDIAISVWRQGAQISDIFRGGYNVRGVVVPEMDPRIYLAILAILVGLLALPGFLQRLWRRASVEA